MKKCLTFLAVCFALNSVAVAAEQVQVLEGTGIDNKACRIEITRDGNVLKNVQIKGAAEVFEIIADRGDGYGPQRHINPNGGEEVLLDSPESFQHFRHSQNIFSEGESFSLDTSNLPSNGEDLGTLKMVMTVSLKYKNGELLSATVSNKAKALVIATLATSKFTCQK